VDKLPQVCCVGPRLIGQQRYRISRSSRILLGCHLTLIPVAAPILLHEYRVLYVSLIARGTKRCWPACQL